MGAMGAPPPAPTNQPPAASASDSQLLGGPQAGPSADMQQMLDAVTRQFRDLQVGISSLAKSFPAAAKDFNAANDALAKAMMTVTRTLTSQQPQSAAA